MAAKCDMCSNLIITYDRTWYSHFLLPEEPRLESTLWWKCYVLLWMFLGCIVWINTSSISLVSSNTNYLTYLDQSHRTTYEYLVFQMHTISFRSEWNGSMQFDLRITTYFADLAGLCKLGVVKQNLNIPHHLTFCDIIET